ncbi:MAG: ribosome assembly cofactor RimP [Muribaculaceae bacterium]|nr:ribosome assembly cofactor RimP [Muribaculaceae bacterium]
MDTSALRQFIEQQLAGSDYFLVDLAVSNDNVITVDIDSPDAVDIDYCVSLSRAIEEAFPRDDEDYELTVGSAGLSAPFKVRGQYDKHIGDRVDVITRDGRKLLGTLKDAGDDAFTIEVETKVRPEGAKRPVTELVDTVIPYADAKSVKYHFDF